MMKEKATQGASGKPEETEKAGGTAKKMRKGPATSEGVAKSREAAKPEKATKPEKTSETGVSLKAQTQVTGPMSEAQLQKEFKKRAGIIKKQISSIQQSFLVIAFQLYWIKDHDMYSPLGYKNIYEFAEMEYGIGRSSCCNLICIVDNYADRDELGNVIESISERYRDFTSSQLIAMIGMSEEGKKRITPDMSVRLINRIRKQEAQSRIGTIRNFGNGADEGRSEEAQETPAVEKNPVTEKKAESRADEENEETAVVAADMKDTAKSHISESNGSPSVSKGPKGSEESHSDEKEKAAAASAPEAGTLPVTTGETKKLSKAAVVVSAGSNAEPDAKKNMGSKNISTLLSFNSYSNYQRELEHMHSIVADIFKQSKTPVTVKIVCEQGIA